MRTTSILCEENRQSLPKDTTELKGASAVFSRIARVCSCALGPGSQRPRVSPTSPPACGWSFHPPSNVIRGQKSFDFDKTQLIFILPRIVLLMAFRDSLLPAGHRDFLVCFLVNVWWLCAFSSAPSQLTFTEAALCGARFASCCPWPSRCSAPSAGQSSLCSFATGRTSGQAARQCVTCVRVTLLYASSWKALTSQSGRSY